MKNIIANEKLIQEDIDKLRKKGIGAALFPFPKFEGVTSSENILINLCKKSFLSLWTLPNLYYKKGKELADVMIIFAEHVIIISDKEGHSQTEDLNLKWKRYQKHIEKSKNQLLGGKRWITKYPEKIFIDAQCTKNIFHLLPKNPKFHLISVLRGLKNDSLKYYKNNDGSLPIDTTTDKLFSITSHEIEGSFIHNFDEIAIDVVLSEMNTISDFIFYLEEREKFFIKNKFIKSFGEKPLLGSFMIGRDMGITDKLFEIKVQNKNNKLTYRNNIYSEYIKTEKYKTWLILKAKSILVDYFIEKFINIGDPKMSNILSTQTIHETENAIREFAKISRMQRVDFYNCLGVVARKSESSPNKSLIQTFTNPSFPEQTFILLFLKKYDEESFDEYRLRRLEELSKLCEKAENSKTFVDSKVFLGFATDHMIKDYEYHSEDLVVLYQSGGEKFDNFNPEKAIKYNGFTKIIELKDSSFSSKKKMIKSAESFFNEKKIFFPKVDEVIEDMISKNAKEYPFSLVITLSNGEVFFETT